MDADTNTPPSDARQDRIVKLPLKELGLRAGIALQVRRLADGAVKREAQLYGAIENKGVMVGPQGPEGEPTDLVEGDVCIVRGFSGQHEFSFVAKVLQILQRPFAYALLSYPTQVDALQVRQSMRVRTRWPVLLQSAQGEQAGQLVDLSPQGAMASTAEPCGAAGTPLTARIMTEIEGEPTTLALQAQVCHSHRAGDGQSHFTGMVFLGLSPQDKLALHYLVSKPRD